MRIYMMGRVYASSIVYEVCEPCEKIIWGSGATYVAGTTEALVIEPPLDFVSPALVPPVPPIDPAPPRLPHRPPVLFSKQKMHTFDFFAFVKKPKHTTLAAGRVRA